MTPRSSLFHAWALLFAASSCHGERRVAAPAVVATAVVASAVVAPAVVARTCPAPEGAAPVAVAFVPRESLGETAGVTRVIGTTSEGGWHVASFDRAGGLTIAATTAGPREHHGLGRDLDSDAPSDPFDSGFDVGELYRWSGAAGACALTLDGDGPTRRLHVSGPASATPTLVADEHTMLVSAARVGERVLVLWTTVGTGGVRARAFDRSCRPVGGPFGFAADVAFVRALHVWRTPQASYVAWKDGANAWRAAPITADASGVGDARELTPAGDGFFLTSAVLPDGVVFAWFTNSVDYDGGRHSWSGSIHTQFVPFARDAPPEAARQIARDGGPGRGELRPFLLVANGRAAVLVSARDGWGSEHATLVTLRVPCAP